MPTVQRFKRVHLRNFVVVLFMLFLSFSTSISPDCWEGTGRKGICPRSAH